MSEETVSKNYDDLLHSFFQEQVSQGQWPSRAECARKLSEVAGLGQKDAEDAYEAFHDRTTTPGRYDDTLVQMLFPYANKPAPSRADLAGELAAKTGVTLFDAKYAIDDFCNRKGLSLPEERGHGLGAMLSNLFGQKP